MGYYNEQFNRDYAERNPELFSDDEIEQDMIENGNSFEDEEELNFEN